MPKIYSLALYAFIFSFVGCDSQTGPSSPNNQSTSTSRPALYPPPDVSLPNNDYIIAGIPSHDRKWGGADMVKAADFFEKFVQTQSTELPRFASEKSGAMFARIVSAENLKMFKDKTLPVEARFPETLDYMLSLNRINKIYLQAAMQNKVGDSELVELYGAVLRLTVVMLDLVDEFLPTIDKNDPTYETRMRGLDQMRTGMAGIASGCITTLTELENYRTSQLVKLIGYMKATFPDILPALTESSRLEVITRLKTLSDDHKMQSLQPSLGELSGQFSD